MNAPLAHAGSPCRAPARPLRVAGGLLACLLPLTAVRAQEPTAGAADSSADSLGTGGDAPLYLGPLELRPFASYSLDHRTGLLVRPGEAQSTTTHRYTPGVVVRIGKHWSFDYTLTASDHSTEALKDTIDHAARLAGAFAYEQWTFGVSHGYTLASATRVETARQTEQEIHATTFDAGVSWERLALGSSTSHELSRVEARGTLENWSQSVRASYELGYGFHTVASLTAAYAELEDQPDAVQLAPRIGLDWKAASKLTTSLSWGRQYRWYPWDDLPTYRTPVMTASLTYTPLETTAITLQADRTAGTSYFTLDTSRTTTYRASISQRLLGYLMLNLSAARTDQNLLGSGGQSVGVRRTDRTDSFDAALSLPLLRRASVSVNYGRTDNVSSAGGFSFDSEHYGLQIAYRF